jgi:hypothetical protein
MALHGILFIPVLVLVLVQRHQPEESAMRHNTTTTRQHNPSNWSESNATSAKTTWRFPIALVWQQEDSRKTLGGGIREIRGRVQAAQRRWRIESAEIMPTLPRAFIKQRVKVPSEGLLLHATSEHGRCNITEFLLEEHPEATTKVSPNKGHCFANASPFLWHCQNQKPNLKPGSQSHWSMPRSTCKQGRMSR